MWSFLFHKRKLDNNGITDSLKNNGVIIIKISLGEIIMASIKEIIERIRRRINDNQSVEFTNDEILSYIHEGLSSLENVLLYSRVIFNLTSVSLNSNYEVLPDDFLEVYRVTFLGDEIEKTDIISKEENKYYIQDNVLFIPYVPSVLHYIKSFERPNENGSLDIDRGYIEYIYRYAVIKSLTRLEYNMDKEEEELSQLTAMVVKNSIHRNGTIFMRRFGDYAL